MALDKLFVYGTLLSELGHPMSHRLKKEAVCIGKGYLWGHLYDLGEYPGLIPGEEGQSRVYGEVYQLQDPERSLRWLDAYEGIGEGELEPWEYERMVLKVFLRDAGVWEDCWVYLYVLSPEQLPLIEQGDYLAFKKLLD